MTKQTKRINYGLSLDIPSGSADEQTAKAFRRIRDGAIELDDIAGDESLILLTCKALKESPALSMALTEPKSVFERKVSSAGVNACSAVGDSTPGFG